MTDNSIRIVQSSWGLLTMGDRPDAVSDAVESIWACTAASEVVVLYNGGVPAPELSQRCTIRRSNENLGIPGGRDRLLRGATSEIMCFLDDDALLDCEHERRDWMESIERRFQREPSLAVISFRIVDEQGETARRHIPKLGRTRPDTAEDVTTFLGGACAIRRSAYEAVGGYWPDLWYGHEELDLAWRLIDAGYRVAYVPDAVIFHPRTEIGRHTEGWRLTGRNRVWIARRNLPWPIAAVHTLSWLLIGAYRAPTRLCRRTYLSGWWSGWRSAVEHRPIRWRTVWRLSRLGRPPLI